MACWLVLAVRPLDDGKTRLSRTLSANDRKCLNLKMFQHVFSISREVFDPGRIVLVSRSEALLAEAEQAGMHRLAERGDGLNEALTQAADHARALGADTLLSLSSDLPFLTAADLQAMLSASAEVAIATDRARRGTNALMLRAAIPYRYGPDSLAAHRAEADRAGLSATVLYRPGLARDIDTPADLAGLRGSEWEVPESL